MPIAIDMRMTWTYAAKIIAAVLQDGTAEGKARSREELRKMAIAADLAATSIAALRELVACKDLKERLEAIEPQPMSSNRNYNAGELREEYERRKPKAWHAARALLANVKAPQEAITPAQRRRS